MPLDEGLLRIYLRDHLAGSVAAEELAKRIRGSNPGTEIDAYLGTFLEQLRDEQQTVASLLRRIEGSPSLVKTAAAWAGEKAARVKLNGRIFGYSALSRLEELEALLMGIRGKQALWEALREVSLRHPLVDADELTRLARTAEQQQDAVEGLRRVAARIAFDAAQPEAAAAPSKAR